MPRRRRGAVARQPKFDAKLGIGDQPFPLCKRRLDRRATPDGAERAGRVVANLQQLIYGMIEWLREREEQSWRTMMPS